LENTGVATKLTNNGIANLTIASATNQILVSGISDKATISIYSMEGALVKSVTVSTNATINASKGLWLVKVQSAQGQTVAKVIVR
jgi:hypothetical protein